MPHPAPSRRALLLALAATGCTPAPLDAARRPGHAAPNLVAFHAALRDLQSGRRRTVNVLQIGDSHTANDAFSGRLRELMGARFGDAGRGFLPPAIPYRYYRPAQLTVQAEGWRPVTAASGAPGPFGLALLRQRADGPATVTVRADEPGGLARIAVDALGQPGGGTLDLAFDTGRTATVPTAAPGPVWSDTAAPGAQTLTLTARGDGPVDLLGLRCGRDTPGVTWSNLGTSGATVALTAAWDPALAAAEMARLDPSLLVLAFGTNEGFKDGTDPVAYRALFQSRLHALRALAPAASALVLLPPDGLRAAEHGATQACRPRPGDRTAYAPPPMLAPVRRIQLEAAAAEGAAVWDWAAAMGGPCSILPLTRTDPPAAAADLVHLFKPGYRATAEALFAAIAPP